jgi:hypothetical protein
VVYSGDDTPSAAQRVLPGGDADRRRLARALDDRRETKPGAAAGTRRMNCQDERNDAPHERMSANMYKRAKQTVKKKSARRRGKQRDPKSGRLAGAAAPPPPPVPLPEMAKH